MEKTLLYHDKRINYTDTGKGAPVVLLHGYLETLSVWEALSARLSAHCRVIAIDLPGHGKTGHFGAGQTMEQMAEVVKFLLDALFIDKCILAGHSMGGYVTLAFVEQYPDRLLGWSMVHSHPLADAPEKKAMRDREIELILAGKKVTVARTNIPKTFANENLQQFELFIGQLTDAVAQMDDGGIAAVLMAMKGRPDRCHVVTGSTLPFLWFLGRKDNLIDLEAMLQKVKLSATGKSITLGNSGHMGFVEEPETFTNFFNTFIKECIVI